MPRKAKQPRGFKVGAVVEYLKQHPDASWQEVQQNVKVDTTVQTFYDARRKLGISTDVRHGVPTQSAVAKKTKDETTLSTSDLVVQVLKLQERAGGYGRLKKVVELCGQLEQI